MYQQVESATLIDITVIHTALFLLACVLFGNNRSRALISASFAFSIINLSHFPAIYFFAIVVFPLTNTANLFEAFEKFPQFYYSGFLFSEAIIAVCCLFAARWLRKARLNPPVKLYVVFNLVFVLFTLIVLVWWEDIAMIMSISFWALAFFGTFFLIIMLFLFYLYTRLTTDNSNEYAQFIQHLSKRELEVIDAVLAGNKRLKELSAALNISVNTVKTHLKHIYQTTGVSSITALSSLFHGFASNNT